MSTDANDCCISFVPMVAMSKVGRRNQPRIGIQISWLFFTHFKLLENYPLLAVRDVMLGQASFPSLQEGENFEEHITNESSPAT